MQHLKEGTYINSQASPTSQHPIVVKIPILEADNAELRLYRIACQLRVRARADLICGMMGGVSVRPISPSQLKPSNHLPNRRQQ